MRGCDKPGGVITSEHPQVVLGEGYRNTPCRVEPLLVRRCGGCHVGACCCCWQISSSSRRTRGRSRLCRRSALELKERRDLWRLLYCCGRSSCRRSGGTCRGILLSLGVVFCGGCGILLCGCVILCSLRYVRHFFGDNLPTSTTQIAGFTVNIVMAGVVDDPTIENNISMAAAEEVMRPYTSSSGLPSIQDKK